MFDRRKHGARVFDGGADVRSVQSDLAAAEDSHLTNLSIRKQCQRLEESGGISDGLMFLKYLAQHRTRPDKQLDRMGERTESETETVRTQRQSQALVDLSVKLKNGEI